MSIKNNKQKIFRNYSHDKRLKMFQEDDVNKKEANVIVIKILPNLAFQTKATNGKPAYSFSSLFILDVAT